MNTVIYEEIIYRKRAIEYTLRVILESFVSVSKRNASSEIGEAFHKTCLIVCSQRYIFPIMNEIFYDKNVSAFLEESAQMK